ncbi:MAG: hypothetical protein ACK55Z_13770, partial [bacterium]
MVRTMAAHAKTVTHERASIVSLSLIKDKETIDTCAATGSAGECAASKRPRVGPKDRNKSADLTGVAAYDHIS